MIFEFKFNNDRSQHQKGNGSDGYTMSMLLMSLKNMTEHSKFDCEFYNFIREIYGIDVKFRDRESSDGKNHWRIIESIEMPDEVYTMLLLIHERH